jgi:hypothetical protein
MDQTMKHYLHLILLVGLLPSIVRAREPEFGIDIMSVLSKAGCNAGACHGNLNGKGGLKLSLRGQDAAFDYQALVVASRGRRVNYNLPAHSLLIQKATGQIPHGGGVRFTTDSQEYKALLAWLNAGANGPLDTDRRLVELEVQPSESIVTAPRDSIQVSVTALYSDGSRQDVTERACYELSNLNVRVDSKGLVTREKFGETALIVRYLDKQLAVPMAFIAARPEFAWEEIPANNFIDHYVFAKLERLRLNASRLCEDNVFVRRAFLDAIGRAPTLAEAQEFVFDASSDKRARLIDELLIRPEFADYWALKWADVLRTEEKVLDATGVDRFHDWIRNCIAHDMPMDQFVRELVTGLGSTYERPAANFYRANRDAVTRGETTARLFLGVRMQCAKCHNHPFDHWTQDDYYQWSSVFSQLDYEIGENNRKDRLDKNEFVGEQIVLVSKQDEIRNPNTGKIAKPKMLGGPELPMDANSTRLEAAADWLTSADNELFAKSQANFVWYHLLGQGLVDPIDDFRLTNPASNPELLDALAASLVDSQFNLRELVRTIMNSRTYQLSSEPHATNGDDTTSFSKASIRRLPAEVLLDLQSDLLDTPAEFGGFPLGLRAVQVPGVERVRPRDEPVKPGDRFLKTFGKPERIMACDCERSNETTLKQAFALLGEGLNGRLNQPDNRLHQLASSNKSNSQIVDELFWHALSRPPSQQELTRALEALDSHEVPRSEVIQDIAWALMNAKEFLFRR